MLNENSYKSFTLQEQGEVVENNSTYLMTQMDLAASCSLEWDQLLDLKVKGYTNKMYIRTILRPPRQASQ